MLKKHCRKKCFQVHAKCHLIKNIAWIRYGIVYKVLKIASKRCSTTNSLFSKNITFKSISVIRWKWA